MKTYKQLAKEYGVTPLTIRNWVAKMGMQPNYFQPSDSPRRKGMACVLDDEQQRQLAAWRESRSNAHK